MHALQVINDIVMVVNIISEHVCSCSIIYLHGHASVIPQTIIWPAEVLHISKLVAYNMIWCFVLFDEIVQWIRYVKDTLGPAYFTLNIIRAVPSSRRLMINVH